MRCGLYLFGTVLSEDVDTQINGAAIVFWPSEAVAEVSTLNSSVLDDIKARLAEQRQVARLAASVPVRVSACHICLRTNDPVFRLIKAFILECLPKTVVCRVRVHSGKNSCVFFWCCDHLHIAPWPIPLTTPKYAPPPPHPHTHKSNSWFASANF
jgi:hypothetical protein